MRHVQDNEDSASLGGFRSNIHFEAGNHDIISRNDVSSLILLKQLRAP
jgi:hypothetical protein